jgi:hypothetical protein
MEQQCPEELQGKRSMDCAEASMSCFPQDYLGLGEELLDSVHPWAVPHKHLELATKSFWAGGCFWGSWTYPVWLL